MSRRELRIEYGSGPADFGVALVKGADPQHDGYMLEVARYNKAGEIVETDTISSGLPSTLMAPMLEMDLYLKTAAKTVEQLRGHNHMGSVIGTAPFAAARGLTAVARSLNMAPPAKVAYTVDLSPVLTSAQRANAFNLARMLDHAGRGRDAATTILFHGEPDGEDTLELRVCNSGPEAFFEWINDAGDPITDVFDVIHGDPEVQVMWLQRHLAEQATMRAQFSASDEDKGEPAPAM